MTSGSTARSGTTVRVWHRWPVRLGRGSRGGGTRPARPQEAEDPALDQTFPLPPGDWASRSMRRRRWRPPSAGPGTRSRWSTDCGAPATCPPSSPSTSRSYGRARRRRRRASTCRPRSRPLTIRGGAPVLTPGEPGRAWTARRRRWPCEAAVLKPRAPVEAVVLTVEPTVTPERAQAAVSLAESAMSSPVTVTAGPSPRASRRRPSDAP